MLLKIEIIQIERKFIMSDSKGFLFKFNKGAIVAIAGLTFVLSLAMLSFLPSFANAATQYPDAEHQDIKGATASTEVGLKTDDSQLSFTAPSIINFAMIDDGTFEYPTTAHFTNKSIFDIKVVKYDVTSDPVAHGKAVANFDTATDDNAYKVKVAAGSGNAIDFAISQASVSADEWIIGHDGATKTLSLTFSDGKIKNITPGTWTDGHKLQDVVWTVAAA